MNDINLYNSSGLERLDMACLRLMLPFQWSIQKIASSCKSTTKEIADRYEDPCYERYVILSFVLPALAIFLLFYSPVYSISLLIWSSIQKYRTNNHRRMCSVFEVNSDVDGCKGCSVSVATINACLIPESRARKQNLGNCQERARQIANCLVEAEEDGENISLSVSQCQLGETSTSRKQAWDREKLPQDEGSSLVKQTSNQDFYSIEKRISTKFPDSLKVVIVNHVTDRRAEDKLIRLTTQKYPYSISRVGVNSWKSNHFSKPSGLVALSTLPITSSRFYDFLPTAKTDNWTSEGVLIFTVDAGIPGLSLLIAAATVKSEAVGKQCDSVKKYVESFKDEYKLSDAILAEIICFCGEHGDDLSYAECIPTFSNLKTRIGTDIQLRKLYKKYMATPSALKMSLSDQSLHNQLLEGNDGQLKSCVLVAKTTCDSYIMEFEDNLVTNLAGLVNVLPTTVKFEFTKRDE